MFPGSCIVTRVGRIAVTDQLAYLNGAEADSFFPSVSHELNICGVLL